MNEIKGGRQCYCSCYYANSGGSGIDANGGANYGLGHNGGHSTKGLIKALVHD